MPALAMQPCFRLPGHRLLGSEKRRFGMLNPYLMHV
jgi:hypothetical protein